MAYILTYITYQRRVGGGGGGVEGQPPIYLKKTQKGLKHFFIFGKFKQFQVGDPNHIPLSESTKYHFGRIHNKVIEST